MLVLLAGYSGTGKSSVQRELIDRYGWSRLVTCTTRPRRESDRSDEYMYWSEEKFNQFESMGGFFETATYNATFGTVKYGTMNIMVKEAMHSNRIYTCIVNPKGIRAFQEAYKDIPVYMLTTDTATLKSRLEKRGDAMEEIERRLTADIEDFKSIDCYEIDIDASLSVSKVADLIRYDVEKRRSENEKVGTY